MIKIATHQDLSPLNQDLSPLNQDQVWQQSVKWILHRRLRAKLISLHIRFPFWLL